MIQDTGNLDNTKEVRRVGTHSGKFHADEVMATAILQQIFELELVRTRDPEILGTLDLVYDVGDGEFDHHQVDKEYRESGTPYAACGLIWRKFGREAVKAREPSLTEEELEQAFYYVDRILIEGIDAADNGIRTSKNFIPTMNITSAIAGFNPPWDSDKTEEDGFWRAVAFAASALQNIIDQQVAVIRAKVHVQEAYNHRPRPELLVLDKLYPWSDSLNAIDTEGQVLFVIYPRDGEYLLQTVRGYGQSFRDRKSLPRDWAGKREEELGKVIGIEDAVFCHTSRFIAGARSFESIMKMAELAIAEPEEAIIVRRSLLSRIKWVLKKTRVVIVR